MAKPLQIMFLMEDLCYGGTQKQSLELATRLDQDKFEPVVVTLTGPTDLDGIVENSGIRLIHMGKDRKVTPFFFIKLGAVIERLKPDILFPCTALPNIWGRVWGKYFHVPVIVGTVRGGGAPARQHERFLWKLTNHIICNSQASIQVMLKKGTPLEHMTYIPNGVDTDLYKPIPNMLKNQNIICVARLAKDKDHKTLIQAFAKIANEQPDCSLTLVGEGPEENNLRQLVGNLPTDISKRIEFTGAAANPAAFYAQASICALSSIREGQPNTLLEAMSMGLPICATNVGGIPALVPDHKAGLLSRAGDVDNMAQNLLQLLQNPDLASCYGQFGHTLVKDNFSFAKMVDSHQNLFEKLWEENKPY